jgi:hypothetical protein
MLGHRGLRNAELGGDHRDDFARAADATGEQFEDTPPDRIAEDIEGVHYSDAAPV